MTSANPTSYDQALHDALHDLNEFLEATDAMLSDADWSDAEISKFVHTVAAREQHIRRRDHAKAAAHAMMQMAQDFGNHQPQTLGEQAIGRHLFALCERYAEMPAGRGL